MTSARAMPIGQLLTRRAQCSADLATDEPIRCHFGQQHVEQHCADPAGQASGKHHRVVPGRGQQAAGDHEHDADQRDAFVAKTLTDHPPRIRNDDAGKKIEPDQQSELGVINSEICDENETAQQPLETERPSRFAQEKEPPDQPPLATHSSVCCRCAASLSTTSRLGADRNHFRRYRGRPITGHYTILATPL